jgi:hypothetical protein
MKTIVSGMRFPPFGDLSASGAPKSTALRMDRTGVANCESGCDFVAKIGRTIRPFERGAAGIELFGCHRGSLEAQFGGLDAFRVNNRSSSGHLQAKEKRHGLHRWLSNFSSSSPFSLWRPRWFQPLPQYPFAGRVLKLGPLEATVVCGGSWILAGVFCLVVALCKQPENGFVDFEDPWALRLNVSLSAGTALGAQIVPGAAALVLLQLIPKSPRNADCQSLKRRLP